MTEVEGGMGGRGTAGRPRPTRTAGQVVLRGAFAAALVLGLVQWLWGTGVPGWLRYGHMALGVVAVAALVWLAVEVGAAAGSLLWLGAGLGLVGGVLGLLLARGAPGVAGVDHLVVMVVAVGLGEMGLARSRRTAEKPT